jgi:hypothetical protein
MGGIMAAILVDLGSFLACRVIVSASAGWIIVLRKPLSEADLRLASSYHLELLVLHGNFQ